MFDPLTVAFEIKTPWRSRPSEFSPKGYRDAILRIWHKDPCSDGSDNSCDWHGHKRKLNRREYELSMAIYHLETILDNSPFYPDHPAHLCFQEVKKAMYAWQRRSKFRIPPRYHFWHWRIQFVPWQIFYRWAFERCTFCSKGFAWNESVMGNWSGTAIWHHSCDKHTYIKTEPSPADKENT